jgi:hypothetical protein
MPQYISASRRNDLPRFHCRQFFDAWKSGEITYDGGWGRSYTVSLRPGDVLGYIFWSKDYKEFLRQPEFRSLLARNNAIFHFTINNMPAIEPGIPPIEQRLETLRALCNEAGPRRVLWRFDPVCAVAGNDGAITTTEQAFFELLPRISGEGITRCYFSFMSLYNKTKQRPAAFAPFDDNMKIEIGRSMLAAASQAGMTLYNCCNEDVPRLVPGIQVAHCIDNDLLRETDRFGVHRALTPAPTRKGCGCFESRDIGSYSPACGHGCLYCYANPLIKPA